MFRSIWLLLSVLTVIDGTTLIGHINNAAYPSSNLTSIFSFESTCYECVCYAFFSNISTNYEALNCYKNNNTCLLFTNYISKSLIYINLDSVVFIKQSVSSQTTMVPSVATSPFQCYIPEWNTTEILFASDGANLNEIHQLYGLFIAANSDTLYIADTGNNRILKWPLGASNGTLIAGGQGPGLNSTQLNQPTEVYVDPNENVYVADAGNYRIQYFDHGSPVGRTIAGNTTSGSTNNLFGNILGLGVDLANNVYVSDYNNARVTKWSPNATYGVQVAGTGGIQGNDADELNIPTAFYVEPTTGTLYIPNQGGHCVTKWSPGNTSGIVVAGTCGISGANETLLNSPRCITFDKYGNMYVLDVANDGRVIMFCPNSLIGIPIITSGLSNPISLAVDVHLNLYVTDWNHNRIVKYTLA